SIQDKTETVAQIQEALQDHHFQLQVWETTGEDDQEKIKLLIKEDPVEAILVGGGDGTIKMVAEGILNSDQRIGIIPLGSANGLATSLEISGLEDAIGAVAQGEEIKMDAIMINGELSLHLSDNSPLIIMASILISFPWDTAPMASSSPEISRL